MRAGAIRESRWWARSPGGIGREDAIGAHHPVRPRVAHHQVLAVDVEAILIDAARGGFGAEVRALLQREYIVAQALRLADEGAIADDAHLVARHARVRYFLGTVDRQHACSRGVVGVTLSSAHDGEMTLG